MVQEIYHTHQTLIRKNPLFSGLSEQETVDILERLSAHTESYRKGSYLHQAGTPFSYFGMVLHGHVIVCTDDINGNRMIMATVESGATFGESLSYLRIPQPNVCVYASEDSTVLWLSVPEILISDRSPIQNQLIHRFLSVMAQRTLSMNTRIQILSRLSLREKIIALLSSPVTKNKAGILTLPFQRDDMAAYLGVNRSALSRELSKMKQEGILDYHKNTFRLL